MHSFSLYTEDHDKPLSENLVEVKLSNTHSALIVLLPHENCNRSERSYRSLKLLWRKKQEIKCSENSRK